MHYGCLPGFRMISCVYLWIAYNSIALSFLQVLSGFCLSGFSPSEIWSKFSSGQAATTIGFSHSKKRSIGGFLYVQISLWALSLTALSGQTLFYEFLRQVWLSIERASLDSCHYWNFSACYAFGTI